MGGGKPNEKDDGAASATDTLQAEILCEYEQIPGGIKQDCALMIRVKAAEPPNEDRRAPVTICAAIDRSASMKENLPLLKETLQFMVQQLRPEDRLSLITFDHLVSVILPLTAMTISGKAAAERAIESIRERGHTNLSGGLIAALQALHDVTSGDNSLVESVLLFSDGKANYGIKDKEGLTKATRSMLEQIGRQACVFTLGYGVEHDSETLHAVADAGNGIFYYIENRDNIPDSFCDCLGGLLSVAAQNVRMTVTAADGVQLRSPFTKYQVVTKTPNQQYQITVPDIYCEEEKCIPLKVSVAAKQCEKEVEEFHLLTCEVDYFDVLTCKPEKLTRSYSIKRSQTCPRPIPNSANQDIVLHTLRCEVADALGQAAASAGRGEMVAAREMLNQCKGRVKKSVAFTTPLAKHLVETIDESLGGLESSQVFREHGRHAMINYSQCHWQQRSSSKPSMEDYRSARSSAPCPPKAKPTGASPLVYAELATDTDTPYVISSKKKMKVAFKRKF